LTIEVNINVQRTAWSLVHAQPNSADVRRTCPWNLDHVSIHFRHDILYSVGIDRRIRSHVSRLFNNKDFDSPLASFFTDEPHYLTTTISSHIPSLKSAHNRHDNIDRTVRVHVKPKRSCSQSTSHCEQTNIDPWISDEYMSVQSTDVRCEQDCRSLLVKHVDSNMFDLVGQLSTSTTTTTTSYHDNRQYYLSFIRSLLLSSL
jgi:hypothetical protein